MPLPPRVLRFSRSKGWRGSDRARIRAEGFLPVARGAHLKEEDRRGPLSRADNNDYSQPSRSFCPALSNNGEQEDQRRREPEATDCFSLQQPAITVRWGH